MTGIHPAEMPPAIVAPCCSVIAGAGRRSSVICQRKAAKILGDRAGKIARGICYGVALSMLLWAIIIFAVRAVL